jgi:hypothetical protein
MFRSGPAENPAMESSRPERRGRAPNPNRPTLGALVRIAIRNRIRESRAEDALWQSSHNLGWVRYACEDGRFVYCGIRRKMGWITGEMGIAHEALELDQLTLVNAIPSSAPGMTCRIQLGMLLHGTDKWWSFGGTEKGLTERLDWIALQMNLRMFSFLASTAPLRVQSVDKEDTSAA